MNESKYDDPTGDLRNVPSVDEILRSPDAQDIVNDCGTIRLARLARAAAEDLRTSILRGSGKNEPAQTRRQLLAQAGKILRGSWNKEKRRRTQRVINATGVVLHTNLGRSPLSEGARRAVVELAGYCNLEYDVDSGKRGKRAPNAEDLVCELCGAEAAVIVNNCAAAAFLVLTALSSGGEAVASRGELVEIGGDFRVPDVLEQSGTRLREVGTTNRTGIADYENAINDQTRILLKVHPSNYRILGFTSTPSVAELSELAHNKGIYCIEDAGSGVLSDPVDGQFRDEPVVRRSIEAGADIVMFSGDKLLGGPQAGIIVGRQEVLERVRRHPVYRAVRLDKLRYAALEATLESHLRGSAVDEIPAIKMLSVSEADLRARAEQLVVDVKERIGQETVLDMQVAAGNSAIGGGSAPLAAPATALITLRHKTLSATDLERILRMAESPVIARIVDERVVLDVRTIAEPEMTELAEVLAGIGRD